MKETIFEALKKELRGVEKNILLKNHTTFKIGGPAEYFFVARKKEDIIKAIAIGKKINLPILVLGGGSNLLVSDKGIKGLVIKLQNVSPIVLKKHNVVEATAGVILGKVVTFSVQKSLKGLEWAGGLPGTFGGAIRGNAGAFGGEMKDSILNVQTLDSKLRLRTLSNKQCEFSYRSSLFKEKNWVVLSASVQLEKGDKKELLQTSQSHIGYRQEKHPLEYPNAGSVFKNIDVKKIPPKVQPFFLDKIKKDPFPIVPAAWFIIGAGLTGKKVGQAKISEKHSNYIVNLGDAKAIDVLELIELVKQKVKKKYGIVMEVEVQLVGF